MNPRGTQNMVLASFFAVLVMVGAYLRIPFPLVPLTLQTFFVLLAGFILGPSWGAVSLSIYMFLGLLGLPVFTAGGGIQYVLNPSFGFVLSFIPGAWLAGKLSYGKPNSVGVYLVAGCAAMVLIYVVGLLWLYLNLTIFLGQTVSAVEIIKTGALPFIPGAVVKVILSSLLAWKVLSRLSKTGITI